MAKQSVSGTVESVNERGIKFDGEWLNYSKFLKGDKPERGDTVTLVVDGKWVNEIKLGGSGSAPRSNGTARASSGGYRSDDTNLRIARQVALKGAVEHFAGSGASTEDIIGLAREFEAYLNEPFGAPAAAAADDEEDEVEF